MTAIPAAWHTEDTPNCPIGDRSRRRRSDDAPRPNCQPGTPPSVDCGVAAVGAASRLDDVEGTDIHFALVGDEHTLASGSNEWLSGNA